MGKQRPMFQVKIKTKDGEPFSFVNYNGETVSKYSSAKLGAIWPSRQDPSVPGGMTFEKGVLEAFVKQGGETKFWINVYPTDDVPNESRGERRQPAKDQFGDDDDPF